MTFNIFANFSSYSIGGYSLYFDYGSAGTNSSQNLAYNTGSGIFYNSNEEYGGWPGSWQNLTDKTFRNRSRKLQDFFQSTLNANPPPGSRVPR